MSAFEHTLLLIDNDDSIRTDIAVYLKEVGYQVIETGDGEEGLALLQQQQPDVVLCDLKISLPDDQSLVRVISENNPTEVPIIVVSGIGMMTEVINILRTGASDFIIKPILDMEVLKLVVDRCIDQARLRQENINYRKELEKANRELNANFRLLEQDQQAGRQVQFKMLPPRTKTFGPFQFSHRIVPSSYLSGDFVDYFTVGDNFVVFYIADVSGHGSSSAFVTVLLKNLFSRKRSDYIHLNDDTILSPIKILQRANRDLINTEIGKFATLCVGVIDLEKDTLCYSVAGHLPLPILAVDGQANYLQGEGMPVGLFEIAEYTENTIQLPKTFVLNLFSDGILEVVSPEGLLDKEKFLLDRLQKGEKSISDIARALELEHVGEAPDDVAALLIQRQ